MWTRRREAPLGLLSWGSNPYPYAPDGSSSTKGTGNSGANLESGLDNGPVLSEAPFNQSGLDLQDEYDVGEWAAFSAHALQLIKPPFVPISSHAGYTGMYLMDCLAQIELAKMIGRSDAASVLQSRFDEVNKAMLGSLWNETAGYFQVLLSLLLMLLLLLVLVLVLVLLWSLLSLLLLLLLLVLLLL
jgi:hypothetical protein